MKISTLIVIAGLGVLAYGVLGPKKSKVSEAASTPTAAPAPVSEPALAPDPVVKATPTAEPGPPVPIPTMQPNNLVVIRGRVLQVVAGRAVVDCDVVAPNSPEERYIKSGGSPASKAALASSDATQVQAQADRDTFGPLKMFDTRGKLRDATIVPQRRIRGMATLAGIGVYPGRMVNVVAAPVTLEGYKVPIYTARFDLVNTWMFNGKGSLDQRAKPGL
jgi:hypothetical protein